MGTSGGKEGCQCGAKKGKTNRSQHEYALLHLGQTLGKAASGTSMGTSGSKEGCQWSKEGCQWG